MRQEDQPTLRIGKLISSSDSSPDKQNENLQQSNKFQTAFQKLQTMKSNKFTSKEHDQPFLQAASFDSHNQSSDQSLTRKQKHSNRQSQPSDFRPPYMDQNIIGKNSDRDYQSSSSDNQAPKDAPESRRTSQNIARQSIPDINIKSRQSVSKNNTHRVAFEDQELKDIVLSNDIVINKSRQGINDSVDSQALNSSPDNQLKKSGQFSQQQFRGPSNKDSLPSLTVTNLAQSKANQGKNLFEDKQDRENLDQNRMPPATLKYCQAISLFYQGGMNNNYLIHSQAPFQENVEISLRPNLNRVSINGDNNNMKWQLQNLKDWECAPALKNSGEIFRILPASEFNNLNKIQKILKHKQELDPIDHYKYGENLESLAEEIKFNLEVFEEYKNEVVKFGSSVIFMHENSQMFLKISSPNLSDQHQHFKLELTPIMSEKTILKLIPSNKIQSEGEGRISETDQFFIAYTYDKILNKDLCLFQDPTLLERQGNRKPKGLNKFNQQYQRLIFSEEKKLPFHFNISPQNDMERNENIYKHLNGKIIQIKHIESDLYLTLTIKRKENRVLTMFFGDKNRYALNKLIDHMPDIYGKEASCNVHFEPRTSINTYWRVHASPYHKDKIYLENAVSKIRLRPLHLQMRSKCSSQNSDQIDQDGVFYKFYSEENSLQSSLNLQRRISTVESQKPEIKYVWVEYLKFNKQENKYEFSKFGSLNDEDKGSLFDSFKIHEVDIYKASAFEFLSNSFKSLKEFDSYQADNGDCLEYDRVLVTIKQLKKFCKNKLEGFIKVEEPCGVPYSQAQNMLKESFIVDEIAELIDIIWPDENYMKADFSGKMVEEKQSGPSDSNSDKSESLTSSSNMSDNGDVHRETKILLAEKIFELLKFIVQDNLPLQEYVFFEIVPNVQKFFGAGFRRNQDYELFNYLVKNCDTFADYKEKTKYNIIFQFIKKLFRENSSEIEINLFSILRSFCINSKGEANNYHQKLLHDLFFFNQLEGIKFKLQEKKTSRYKSTIQASVADDNPEVKSVKKIQRDLQILEQQSQYSKSKSMKDIKDGQNENRMLTKNAAVTSSRANLHPIVEIKFDFSNHHEGEKDLALDEQNFEEVKGANKKQNNDATPFKSTNQKIFEESDTLKESQSPVHEVRYETYEDESDDFLIRSIHEITLDKITENFILNHRKDSNLLRVELYFYADLCYMMNFGCKCTSFSQQTVSNLLKLLSDQNNKLDSHLKAGLARMLNTILRNNDDNILDRPYFLRIYEKQEFTKPTQQKILQKNDVRTLVKLTRDNFRQLSVDGYESFTEYDSEILRLTQYLIHSNLIFEKDFQEGYNYVQDIFEDIARMNIQRQSVIGEHTQMNLNKSQYSGFGLKAESSLNTEDFQKQYTKIRKLVESYVYEGVQGLQKNPFAWKMLNIEKLYSSFVEDLVNDNKSKNLLSQTLDINQIQMEAARLEMVQFYQWLINLRIDSLITSVVNMFFTQIESFLEREDADLDSLIQHPEKYFTFQYMQRLMSDIMKMNDGSNGSEHFSFLEDIIRGSNGKDGDNKSEIILDLEEMYSKFIQNQSKFEILTKARPGFSSPIRHEFLTETDEIKECDRLLPKEDYATPTKGHIQYMHQTEGDLKVVQETEDLDDIDADINSIQNKNLNPRQLATSFVYRSIKFLRSAVLQIYNRYQEQGRQSKDIKDSIKDKQQRRQLIDILIDIFVTAQSPQIQQETIRAIYKYLNVRRELLQSLSKTILIFKQSDKGKIQKMHKALKNIRLISLDSTIWELPSEKEAILNLDSAQTKALDDLKNEDLEQPVLRSNTKGNSSANQSKKFEYAQKIKEHQKNQQLLIQQLSFTKSNKPTKDRIAQIDILIENLESINEFFLTNQRSQLTFDQQSQNKENFDNYEKYLRAVPSEDLDQHLSFIQQDLQYAFLAMQGQDLILKFMKTQNDLRQECMRVIFFGTKPKDGRIFGEETKGNLRMQYAIKILIAYKKCYEVLIKFVYNNKTAKQVMLGDLEDILLFNSEYYMHSKMTYQITLYEFELLNYILDDNSKIQTTSSTLATKITNLVSFIHKIIEFPRKPLMFSPMILKVYSNIIANCDNPKINDYVVDLILREEVFFQIQSLLLGINMKKSNLNSSEQLTLIEKFLRGISQILQNSNVRMIKKKFYQIFQKSHDQETYFNHLRELLNQSCNQLRQSLQKSSQGENISKFNKVNSLLAKSQSTTISNKIEDEIKIYSQKFLRVETYLIIIFNKLFFDVKGTQKQIQDKVDEMRIFIEARERDVTILESHGIKQYLIWPEFNQFEDAINECAIFCSKNQPKANILMSLSTSMKKSFNRNKSILSLHADNSRRNSDQKQITPRGGFSSIQTLLQRETLNSDQISQADQDNTSQNSLSNKLKPMFQQKMNSILTNLKSNQLASKKEQIFKIFKWNTLHDEDLRNELKREQHAFSEILLRKFKLADENSYDIDQQKYFLFFTKLVQYSNLFLIDKEKLIDTKILVDTFSQFIDLTNEGQSYKGEGFEAKTIIQEKLHQIGAVQMALDMMCSENNEKIDEIFPQLLYFSNRILDGAGNNIQDFFTEYLIKNEKAINLFERCYNLIDKEIQQLRKHASAPNDKSQVNNKNQQKLIQQQAKVPKAYDKSINVQKQILKFFKNLCENHNTKMQLLVGNQQNSERNFDMVSLTVNYLHALISNINLSKRNYSNAQNCCISLAEYIQGPCFVNQNRIKDANFYQLAIQILSLRPNLTDEQRQNASQKNEESIIPEKSMVLKRRKSMRISRTVTLTDFNLSQPENSTTQTGSKVSNVEKQDFQLSNFMIQKLKLNCTIILLSLLEQRSSDDPLLLSMKRSIPLEIIKQNIVYEYFLFCKDYNKFLSRENFFRHVLTQSDYDVKEELIIEVGFNLYFLMKRWSEHKKSNDSQLEDLMNIIDSEQPKGYSIFSTVIELYNLYLKVAKDIKKRYKLYWQGDNSKDQKLHNRQKLQKFIKEEKNLNEALLFFKNNSASIDVLVKNSIEQVHFPYMPYCTYLSEEEKVEFYNALPTDRDKEKIEVLVNTSTDLIRRMKIEYQFKKFFIEYPLIGELVYHTEQWKSIAFYIIIMLNLMNLYSFSANEGHDRLSNPAFFNLSNSATQLLYFILGIIQMILSILINFTIISKRTIYHYQLVFDEQRKVQQELENEQQNTDENEHLSFWQRLKKEIFKDIKDYSISACQDFQLLYYLGYLIFSFLGFIYHPFFYSYHITDLIIRNPYLKNVLKAIYRPRYELFNTVILFLCLQYIFSMIAYVYFFDDFEKGECSSLSQCFMVIIDQTFKNDGGIGTFMQRAYPEEMNKGGVISMSRFAFDNFFNVLLVILVVEIISGIIIDTFGALREEHNKITESIENKCMICGKNRDQIEKEYQDMLANEDSQAGSSSTNKQNDERAFEIHKKYKHNIYDYIFFLAYLQEKPELEYTGLESFVSEKYDEKNNTWFPIYKVGGEKSSRQQIQAHDEDNSDDGSDKDNEDQDNDQDQNQLGQDEEGGQGSKQADSQQAQTNKYILEYLMHLNQKIDVLNENLGQGYDNEENAMFNSNAGLGLRQQNTNQGSVKRDGSAARLQTLKVKNPNNNTNLLGPGQSLNVISSNPRTSSANFISRQSSSRFLKTKAKLNAFNAFLK